VHYLVADFANVQARNAVAWAYNHGNLQRPQKRSVSLYDYL